MSATTDVREWDLGSDDDTAALDTVEFDVLMDTLDAVASQGASVEVAMEAAMETLVSEAVDTLLVDLSMVAIDLDDLVSTFDGMHAVPVHEDVGTVLHRLRDDPRVCWGLRISRCLAWDYVTDVLPLAFRSTLHLSRVVTGVQKAVQNRVLPPDLVRELWVAANRPWVDEVRDRILGPALGSPDLVRLVLRTTWGTDN